MTVLEHVTRTALLGVRFWDRVTGRPVADGLQVVEPVSGTVASVGPSGVFAFHDLPGFAASAYGAGDEEFWASPPERADVRFALTDATGRFVPYTFDADVPARGLFSEDCGLPASPPDVIGALPLFSTASRTVASGMARVTADLVDASTGDAAAYAVLEVQAPSMLTQRGVADADGRVAVLFAYPEPPPDPGGSPPPGSRALTAQTWPLTLTVHYAPAATAAFDAPDLCAVLTQPAGTLLGHASPPDPLGPQTLAFGRELALRTSGHSELLVLPA